MEDKRGSVQVGNEVADVFLEHYKTFLDKDEMIEQLRDAQYLFLKRLDNLKAGNMVKEVQDGELKAMFEIGQDKAHGPGRYTSVKDFFVSGKLLKG